MSIKNEVNNTEQPSTDPLIEHPTFDQRNPLTWNTPEVGPAQESVGVEDANHVIASAAVIAAPKSLTTARAPAKRGRGKAQENALASITDATSSAPVKRTRTQSVKVMKDESEAKSKPKRTSVKRATKVADVTDLAIPAGSDMPPVTPAAIEFLAKQDATAADALALGPDSLAFVQYHFRHMEQIEANSQLTNAFLVANARPASSAFKHSTHALAKHAFHEGGQAVVNANVDLPGSIKRQSSNVVIPSFAQKAAAVQPYMPVVVQLRQIKLHIHKPDLHAVENAIERGRGQVVTAMPGGDSITARATDAQPTAPAEPTAEQPGLTSSGTVERKTTPLLALSRRLGLAFAGATDWASGLLSIKDDEGPALANGTRASLDKSADVPVRADDKSTLVPESVARKFLRVERNYYFQDRTPAFSDQGNKLTTPGSNPAVVVTMVEIAKVRGWDTVTVKGTEEFRRSAWIEAMQHGITVGGYKPTAVDMADLANRPSNNIVEKGVVQEQIRTLKRSNGQGSTVQSGPVKKKAAKQATIQEPTPDVPLHDPNLVAKARAFQEKKPAFVVKKYPDLAAAYGIIAAARAFAAEKLPDVSHEEFVDLARRHVVEKIMGGKQIQGPKIYSAVDKSRDVNERSESEGEAVGQGKAPPARSLEKER